MARRGSISSETISFIIKIVFVLLAIVIIYIIILRHPKFLEWLKGLGTYAQEGRNFGSVPETDVGTSQSQASSQEVEQETSQSQSGGDTIIYNCQLMLGVC